jgi:uncharacterized protein (TIGR02594 family)
MSTFVSDLLKSHQGRLADLGYYAGRIDGEPGPLTSLALSRFKKRHGMAERDYPGPLTMAALWSPDAKPEEPVGTATGTGLVPPWLVVARQLLGTREVPGKASNSVITGWAKDLDTWFPGDDIPWCGLFVAHCMSKGAPGEPQDFNRLGARAWRAFGEESGPLLGAVTVLWRTHPTQSVNGHVGFLTGISDDGKHIRLLGGNQGDTVSEAWFPASRLLGYRVPADYAGPAAPRAKVGALSTSEA